MKWGSYMHRYKYQKDFDLSHACMHLLALRSQLTQDHTIMESHRDQYMPRADAKTVSNIISKDFNGSPSEIYGFDNKQSQEMSSQLALGKDSNKKMGHMMIQS